MGPVKFNEIFRIANDEVRARHQPIEPRAGVDRLQAQRAPLPFDLHRLTRGEDLVEDGVDVLAQFGRGEFHSGNIYVRTVTCKRTYVSRETAPRRRFVTRNMDPLLDPTSG